MDPSSVIRFFFFVCFSFSFFVLLQIHLVFGHANLDICQVLWIRDSFVVPTYVYNKALQEGFNACKHHKCFILSMHRLGCWKERLLYSVPALVCAISLMSFCVYLIAAVFFSIHLLHSKRRGRGVQKNIVLIVVRRVNEFERLCFVFLRECVCERNASAPHGAFLVSRVGFLLLFFV